MNRPQNAYEDLANAFKILGKSLPETEEEISEFLAEFNSDDFEIHEVPAYLSHQAIIASIIEGHPPTPPPHSDSNVVPSIKLQQPPTGIDYVIMAQPLPPMLPSDIPITLPPGLTTYDDALP
jgi:hypothetical protein